MRQLVNEGGHRSLSCEIMDALRAGDWDVLVNDESGEQQSIGAIDEVSYDGVVIRTSDGLVGWTYDRLHTVTIL